MRLFMAESENQADYGNFSDKELLVMLKNGSEKAFTEIIKRYSGTVMSISCSYYADALTSDDWFQEGMIGLLNAVKSYNDKADTSFATYAAVCIRNRINSVWRNSNSKKNFPLNNCVELTETTLPCVNSPEEDYIINEQYLYAVSSFMKQLSPTERDVFLCYLSGFGYNETAEKLGINEKSVDNALCRAKIKLKKAIRK